MLTVAIIILAITLSKSYKKKVEQESMQYKYYLATMPLPVDDINILDKIIQDEFHRYEIMELAHKENLYVTADIQNKMIRTIFTKVYKSLSDDLFNKFSIIYKKEYIEDLIAQKVQMVVLNYTIEINGNYKDTKK